MHANLNLNLTLNLDLSLNLGLNFFFSSYAPDGRVVHTDHRRSAGVRALTTVAGVLGVLYHLLKLIRYQWHLTEHSNAMVPVIHIQRSRTLFGDVPVEGVLAITRAQQMRHIIHPLYTTHTDPVVEI